MAEAIVGFLETYYLVPARFIFVILVLLMFIQLRRKLMSRTEPEQILAVLDVEHGSQRIPLLHYETTIGRSHSCDVVLDYPFISRQHAVLSVSDKGQWHISDTNSKGGLLVNRKEQKDSADINIGDEVSLAGISIRLKPAIQEDAAAVRESRKEKSKDRFSKFREKLLGVKKEGSMTLTLVLLNIFQLMAFIQLFIALDEEYNVRLMVSFGSLMVVPWIYQGIAKAMKIKNTSPEVAAFFLTSLGFCTTASANPGDLYKELGALALGLVLFCTMMAILKNLRIVMKLRGAAGGLSLLALLANMVLGSNINGQTNWIRIGNDVSIQPSEFVKILFVFTGAATLEWLLTTRNLTKLTLYAVGCVGLLVIMGDFGTALIFFFAFIVLVFMNTGDIRAIGLVSVAAGLGGGLVLRFRPYIMRRFSAWRNVWAYASGVGFQQTRALMAIASGGLLGLGAGNGFFKRIYAADTDLVFGMIVEEWGLLIGFLVIGFYIMFMLSAIRSYRIARSSYYVIAACTACCIYLFQAALNIFGTTDILPITGVTLPFVSNGGSSLAASWGMLSFLTAALNYSRPKKFGGSIPKRSSGNA